MKGNCAPTSDAPNLQRLVYDVDVAVGATECNPTQAAAREAAVKCHGMEAWGAYKFSDRWAPSCQGNSQLSVTAAIQRRHEHQNNEINRHDL